MLRTVDVDSASELEFQASDDTCNVAEYNKVGNIFTPRQESLVWL